MEYSIDAVSTLQFSVARKTRFATTKDRYSYRLGTAIPNPHLQAEYAINTELGYKGSVNNTLNIQAALFYSKIHNTILMVSNVRYDSGRRAWQSQLQNVAQSEYSGAEIGAEYQVISSLKTGLNYTYIKRSNLTNPSLKFIDVPRHKLFGFVQYQSKDRLSAQVNTEVNAKRFSTTYGTSTPEFTLVNTSASLRIWRWFSVEAGINNITDKNYSLAEGYPEPGRNYSVNLLYRL